MSVTTGSKAQPFPKGPAVILFADLVSSSELSEHLGLDYYGSILRELHRTAAEIARQTWADERCCLEPPPSDYFDAHAISPRGDEVCWISARLTTREEIDFNPNFISSPVYGQWVMRTVLAAMKFALALKAAWLVSEYNLKHRILRGTLPLDAAVGIHIGPVALVADRDKDPLDVSDFLGPSINLAKRIEGAAREGQWCSIMVTPQYRYVAQHALPDVVFEAPLNLPLKGFLRPPRIYEVREVLFVDHFFPQGWTARIPGGITPEILFDTLEGLVNCHDDAPALRFICSTALGLCGAQSSQVVLASERLIQGTYDAARSLFDTGRIKDARVTLMRHYDAIRGHPRAEALLQQCAMSLGLPTEQAEHTNALSNRKFEYFSEGVWTKGV